MAQVRSASASNRHPAAQDAMLSRLHCFSWSGAPLATVLAPNSFCLWPPRGRRLGNTCRSGQAEGRGQAPVFSAMILRYEASRRALLIRPSEAARSKDV
jgi:hypothetical protein